MKNSITGIRLSTFVRIMTVLIFVSFAAFFAGAMKEQKELQQAEIDSLNTEIDSLKAQALREQLFTPENFKKYLYQLEFAHPEIIYKVAIIETGNFKSRKFLQLNNLWGLQTSDTKPLKFENWRDCVKWQWRREFCSDIHKLNGRQYIQWLKSKQYNGVYNIAY